MSTNHTPEPWQYGTFPKWQPVRSNYHVVRPQGEFPHGAWIADFGYPHDEIAEANAQRAVACVNACSGINPEAVPYVVAALRGLLEGYERLLAQSVLDVNPSANRYSIAARSALAKLEDVG